MDTLNPTAEAVRFDLSETTVRELNQYLHHDLPGSGAKHVEVLNPNGRHNLAVGVDAPVSIDIRGHAGYFVGGMNKLAHITVHGNVGWSVGENIMSGSIRVKGNASECVAASGHGGLVVIEGDASSRCGISMKGCDIVVGGSVGHMSAFMAQAGTLVVCGDADPGLGDSLYEAVIYVRGTIHGLGADAREEPMSDDDYARVANLLERAGFDHDLQEFKRVASARSLYHWNADHHQEY
ncbi:glutamate synthase alpha subunit domain protein [Thioalkalivibrio sulfidiphilus HL-EbGr7]|uniref:Glutamate synthase alpha subunit domain protein n=1 Tax=Thioalkalivibrio sulfidiphilus (strain HL-EbGR7) TaxID=396588 RepID=B8GS79_THISH|nr:protein glxC [Thioalkalivibrio sulfidiphilus]ACL72783.1 glutamate synthase alpha subunit domain protein [Thioalkalivibrio sulfidiphilus HL-EbGr7]